MSAGKLKVVITSIVDVDSVEEWNLGCTTLEGLADAATKYYNADGKCDLIDFVDLDSTVDITVHDE